MHNTFLCICNVTCTSTSESNTHFVQAETFELVLSFICWVTNIALDLFLVLHLNVDLTIIYYFAKCCNKDLKTVVHDVKGVLQGFILGPLLWGGAICFQRVAVLAYM